MSDRLSGWMAWVCVMAAAAGACDDPFDNVLCSYTLSPSEEAGFSATDGQVSPFWQSWDARDYVDLIEPHCLRWLGKDPWAEDAKTVNYWGDLLLAGDLGSVVPATGVRSARPGAAARRAAAGTAARAVYNLKGERVAADARAASMVLVNGGARAWALANVR